MALSYGFYDSVNHDRRYNATQISQMFDGIISDGVYANYAKCMIVKASPVDNQVIVQPGRAWFNHTWTYNDADLPVDVPASALILDRIDALCIDINSDGTVRANSLVWVQGEESSDPAKPTNFANTETHHQYPLCFVRRHADVATIAQEDIENAVGTSLCPFVTGIIDTINTDELLLQWTAQFGTWSREQRTAFMHWFENLQYVLDGDVAGHLQNEIDDMVRMGESIFYIEYNNDLDQPSSRSYASGVYIYFPEIDELYEAVKDIGIGATFADDTHYGPDANISLVAVPITQIIRSQIALVSGQLVANGNRIYMDYHDGKYGYNTSASRGADTFHPFSEHTEELLAEIRATSKMPINQQQLCPGTGRQAKNYYSYTAENVSYQGNTVTFWTGSCPVCGKQETSDRDWKNMPSHNRTVTVDYSYTVTESMLKKYDSE